MFLQAKAQKQAGVKHCLKLAYIYNKERKKLKFMKPGGFKAFHHPLEEGAGCLERKGLQHEDWSTKSKG